MTRLAPSIVAARSRAAVLAASLSLPLVAAFPAVTFAQDAAPAATATPAADPLKTAVEDFWHFGKVARYDIAAAKGADVISNGSDPVKVLAAFEAVAADRGDNLDEWLIRFQNADPLKDVAGQIVKIVNDGRFTRRADPVYIENNIGRLSAGDRPYRLALAQLRESGELAVPFLLTAVTDPAKPELHGPARRAIIDLGRFALNPLVAATESAVPEQLDLTISLLSDLGYDAAIPYLQRLAENGPTEPIKASAAQAVTKLGGQPAKAGDLFYDLADKLYYDKSSIVADARYPMANVWSFDKDKGLVRTPVPPAIFGEIMSLRASEYALTLGSAKDALSLWLAANYKREVMLPAGATDPTRAANQPSANYYGVTAGAQFLNAALTRALADKNAPVALAVVKSLQEIVGDSNFKSGGSPLIDAMSFGDRRVRFEAAFTLAEALPQQPFAGQEIVVPLLAEAIAQTGQPSVLVVMPTQEAVNGIVEPLKGQGYITAGATTAAAALSASAAVPAIDVVVISEDLPPVEIETLLGLINQSPKLRASGKLFIVKSPASPWEARKATDPTISTTTTSDPSALKSSITTARDASGALPLDPAMAAQYATRSGELIKKLAISRGQVFDLTPARSTLLGALEDTRPDIVKLAGQGLALMNNEDAQKGLLLKATTDATPDDTKVSLFKSLATSAKFFGDKLDQQQVDALDQVVMSATNADVKAAAADARGALNLPSDVARKLIVDQAKH